MIPVKRLMTKNLIKVDSEKTVLDVSKIMRDKKIGSVLVANGKNVVGIVTETDIVRKVVAQGVDPGSYLVKGVMSSPVFTIDGEKTIFEAGEMMDEKKVRHLVVTEGGEVFGMVSIRDIINPKYYEFEKEAW